MACIFLFLSPRSILVFEKIYFPLQNLFFIFLSFINLKVFRLKSRFKFDYSKLIFKNCRFEKYSKKFI
jgi:hypothetical protein